MRLADRRARVIAGWVGVAAFLIGAVGRGRADEPGDGWVDLMPAKEWAGPIEGWAWVGAVQVDAKDPKRLESTPGMGMMTNGPAGKAKNLVSKRKFGDVELHAEFFIPKGSNSGIKFQGVYEVQIFDSFGKPVDKLKGSDSGGIYPRSEAEPKYHHIDDGIAPKANAARAPGEWQALDVTFHAPRLGPDGQKTADARITVALNGQTVHDDQPMATPTGAAWKNKPVATGPILVQADHGPVAFRSLKARPVAPVGEGPKP